MAGFRDISPENPFYDDPADRKTSIASERRAEKSIVPFDQYEKYANRPYSEVCTELPGSTRLFWEDCAREISYSSRLLPENPESLADKYPEDAAHIVRTKYLGKENPSTWLFNGNYSKDNFAIKFIIKEIDLTKIHGTDWFTPQRTFITELVKELYMLFYFSHDNLQQALFCRTEPELFRMNIALPRTIPLIEISQKFALRYRYSETVCSSMQYVPICILRAIAYLHDCNITHNDVSISNCVVAGNGHVMLGGFQKLNCKQRTKNSS
jgi:serine/threonine protein kinase